MVNQDQETKLTPQNLERFYNMAKVIKQNRIPMKGIFEAVGIEINTAYRFFVLPTNEQVEAIDTHLKQYIEQHYKGAVQYLENASLNPIAETR